MQLCTSIPLCLGILSPCSGMPPTAHSLRICVIVLLATTRALILHGALFFEQQQLSLAAGSGAKPFRCARGGAACFLARFETNCVDEVVPEHVRLEDDRFVVSLDLHSYHSHQPPTTHTQTHRHTDRHTHTHTHTHTHAYEMAERTDPPPQKHNHSARVVFPLYTLDAWQLCGSVWEMGGR